MVKLLGIGSDISKARSRLSPNFEILDYPETEDKINQYIRETIEKEYEGKPLLSTLLEQLFLNLLYILIKESIINVSKRVSRRPFRVACIDVYTIEVLYLLSNNSDKAPDTFLEKLFLRKVVPNVSAVFNSGDASGETILTTSEFLRKTFAEERQGDPDFPLLFAYTIRQTSINDLDAFLSYRKRLYKGDFYKFLELVLLDNDDGIVLPKQKKFCQGWLTNQSSKENKPNYLPESRVPKGWVSIPGRLKEDALMRFFSFLFLEKDRTGNSLLTREDTEELLKYGFAYPEQAEVERRLTLNTGGKLPKWFVYHMFYELYQAHKKTLAPLDYKDHFARFLKHRFTNFEPLTINMLKNSLRNYEHINSRRRGFDITTYLPVNGQKKGR